MQDQPIDIIKKIASELPLRDMIALSLTCYQYYMALRQPDFAYQIWAKKHTHAIPSPDREFCQSYSDFHRIIHKLYYEPPENLGRYANQSSHSDVYVNLVLKTPLLVAYYANKRPSKLFIYILKYPQFTSLVYENNEITDRLKYSCDDWENNFVNVALIDEPNFMAFLHHTNLIVALCIRCNTDFTTHRRYDYAWAVYYYARKLEKILPDHYCDRLEELRRLKQTPQTGLGGWVLYDFLMDLREDYLGLEPVPYERGTLEEKLTNSESLKRYRPMPRLPRHLQKARRDAEYQDEQRGILCGPNTRIPQMFRVHCRKTARRLNPEKYSIEHRPDILTIPEFALKPVIDRSVHICDDEGVSAEADPLTERSVNVESNGFFSKSIQKQPQTVLVQAENESNSTQSGQLTAIRK